MRLTDVDVGRHHVGDQDVERLRAIGQPAYDVTLGHDAGNVPAVVADDQRAHVVLGERLDQLGNRCLGPDGHDRGRTLGLEDVLDPHNWSPALDTARGSQTIAPNGRLPGYDRLTQFGRDRCCRASAPAGGARDGVDHRRSGSRQRRVAVAAARARPVHLGAAGARALGRAGAGAGADGGRRGLRQCGGVHVRAAARGVLLPLRQRSRLCPAGARSGLPGCAVAGSQPRWCGDTCGPRWSRSPSSAAATRSTG